MSNYASFFLSSQSAFAFANFSNWTWKILSHFRFPASSPIESLQKFSQAVSVKAVMWGSSPACSANPVAWVHRSEREDWNLIHPTPPSPLATFSWKEEHWRGVFAIQTLGSVPTSFPNKKAGAVVGRKEILRIEDTYSSLFCFWSKQ